MNNSQNGKGLWHQACGCVYDIFVYVSFILFAISSLHFHLLYIIRMSNLFESLLISTFLRQKSFNKKHIACHISFGTCYLMKTSRWRNSWAVDSWVQRHATFLTRDLRAPSGGSEYHLEVRESADCLQTIQDLVIKLLWNFEILILSRCEMRFWQLVSVLLQHVLQVWMHLFRMSETAIGNPSRDLSQLPLLPTKVMRCEGWNCSW